MSQRNFFKAPEGTYHLQLDFRMHAVLNGAKPHYHKPTFHLRSASLDLADYLHPPPILAPKTSSTATTGNNTNTTTTTTTAVNHDNPAIFITVHRNEETKKTVFCHDLLSLLEYQQQQQLELQQLKLQQAQQQQQQQKAFSTTNNTQNTTNNQNNTQNNSQNSSLAKKSTTNIDQIPRIDQLTCDLAVTCHQICPFDLRDHSSQSTTSLSSHSSSSSSPHDSLNVLIGFINGSIAIHNVITKRNRIFNQDASIDSSPVKHVQWLLSPTTSNTTNTTTTTTTTTQQQQNNQNSQKNQKNQEKNFEKKVISFLAAHQSGNIYLYHVMKNSNIDNSGGGGGVLFELEREKSHEELNYRYWRLVETRSKTTTTNMSVNPVAKFSIVGEIPKNTPTIHQMKVSPDYRMVALACNDGTLKMVDIRSGELFCMFESYYGAFTCCDWSRDMRWLVAGGEDDLITVFDWRQKRVVARGTNGHTSFVSQVKFDVFVSGQRSSVMDDGHHWHSSHYRIVSVGEDCKVILWDLEGLEGLGLNGDDDEDFDEDFDENFGENCGEEKVLVVKSVSMDDVMSIDPIQIHRAHDEPIRDLQVSELGIVTACNRGIIKLWRRPTQRPSTVASSASVVVSSTAPVSDLTRVDSNSGDAGDAGENTMTTTTTDTTATTTENSTLADTNTNVVTNVVGDGGNNDVEKEIQHQRETDQEAQAEGV